MKKLKIYIVCLFAMIAVSAPHSVHSVTRRLAVESILPTTFIITGSYLGKGRYSFLVYGFLYL